MPLLSYKHQERSLEQIVEEVTKGVALSKNIEEKSLLSDTDKQEVVGYLREFFGKSRNLDSLEEPFYFFLEKKRINAIDKPSKPELVKLQVFFLSVCVCCGGSCFTKEQNGKKAKVHCVDLLLFPSIDFRVEVAAAAAAQTASSSAWLLDSGHLKDSTTEEEQGGDRENGIVFLCDFPFCKAQKNTQVFVFNDNEELRRRTKSGKREFVAMRNERKNFFRHLATHFIGLNHTNQKTKSHYYDDFKICKLFFPNFCLCVPQSLGNFLRGSAQPIDFPRPLPCAPLTAAGSPPEDQDVGTFERVGDTIHFYNDSFNGDDDERKEDDDDDDDDDEDDDDGGDNGGGGEEEDDDGGGYGGDDNNNDNGDDGGDDNNNDGGSYGGEGYVCHYYE